MFWAWVLLLAGLVAAAPLQSEEAGEEVTTELGKQLRESLNHVLEKIKEAKEHGRKVKEELIEHAKELKKKLDELKEGIGRKAKDLFNRLKDRFQDWFKNIFKDLLNKEDKEDSPLFQEVDLDKILDKIITDMDEDDFLILLSEVAHESSLKEMWDQLKETFKNWGFQIKKEHTRFLEWAKENCGKLIEAAKDKKAKIEVMAKEAIGRMKEMGSKTREECLKFLQQFKDELGSNWQKLKEEYKKAKKDQVTEEGPQEYWEKMKEYFKNLKEKLGENLEEFKKWAKDAAGDALDHSKTKIEALRYTAKKFISHLKFLSKEVREGGLEFLREYKEQLGGLWDDVVRTFKETIEKEIEEHKQHGIKSLWQDIKDFFDKAGLKIKEKYATFGEWVQKNFSKNLEKYKGKLEKIKGIAKRFIAELKDLKEDVKNEGMGYLKDHKDNLGDIWEEAKDAFKKAGGDLKKIVSDDTQESETFDRIKEYFKDLKLKIKDYTHKFGQWVKDTAGKALENASGHAERIRIIAEKFKRQLRFLKDDVKEQGLEFLRQYKEELGDLWDDVVKSFKDSLNKKVTDEDEVQESIDDLKQKIKDWFNKMNLIFKDKFSKFNEWVKSKHDELKGLANDKIELLKKIADLAKDRLGKMKEDLREQALGFLKEHKDLLGKHWDEFKEEYNKIKKEE